jgi:ribosomal-protein-alanine N-acetyltransferase
MSEAEPAQATAGLRRAGTPGAERLRSAPQRIETARMVGERITLDHEDELVRLQLDPRVAKTLWSEHETRTREEVRAGLHRKLAHWKRHGFGQWLFRDRATGAMVGRGGPQRTMASGRDEIELGWVIVPERWGEGLATELARASLEVVFGPLALRDVIAYTQPDNLASRRVMEKSGFLYDREITFKAERFVLYRCDAPAA